MLLAEIGLPPGAEMDREQLAELEAIGSIGRYEIEPDHITFYTWASTAAGTQFTFPIHTTIRYSCQSCALRSLRFLTILMSRVVLAPQSFVVPARK